jgi:hypothetical protein
LAASADRRFFTADRRGIALGPELARGGEAAVHPLAGRSETLAKIYLKSRAEMREKLDYMCQHPPDDPARSLGHASIAWPEELLFDGAGHFAGYTMPHIRQALPLLEIFNPRRRAKRLPGFDARYLHRTARNLSSALAALHAVGYVVGDLSERNALVTPRTLVTLIDTDSFQVQRQREGQIVVYPCPVGRSEYTPQELQGQAFRGLMRRPEHDCFGLAVLIFQILMEGNHPYRGRWSGAGEPPSLEAKIAAGHFPWNAAPGEALQPPPGAPALNSLDPDLVELFLACFVDGHDQPALRPSAETWADSLEQAEDSLVQCNSGHVFAGHLRRCPSCGGRRVRGSSAPRQGRRDPSDSRNAAASRSGGASAPLVGALAIGQDLASASLGGLRALVGLPAAAFGWLGGAAQTFTAHDATAHDATAPNATAPGSTTPGFTAGPTNRSTLAHHGASPLVPPPAPGLGPALSSALSRALGLALLAAPAAILFGSLAALLQAGVLGLLLDPILTAGASPAGLSALLLGGLGVTAGSALRALHDSPQRPTDPDLLRAAGLTAASSLAGWLAGWATCALITHLTLGQAWPLAALGSLHTADTLLDPAWPLAWTLYGALGGSLEAQAETAARFPWRPAASAAVLAGLGWLFLRLAALVFVGG